MLEIFLNVMFSDMNFGETREILYFMWDSIYLFQAVEEKIT